MSTFNPDKFKVTADTPLAVQLVIAGIRTVTLTMQFLIEHGTGRGSKSVAEMVNIILNSEHSDALVHETGKNKGKAKSLNTIKASDSYKAWMNAGRPANAEQTHHFAIIAGKFKTYCYDNFDIDSNTGKVKFRNGQPVLKKGKGSGKGSGADKLTADAVWDAIQKAFDTKRADKNLKPETIIAIRSTLLQALSELNINKNLPEVAGSVK